MTKIYFSFQIFPNPFYNTASVILNLPESTNASLRIYDLYGKKIKEIDNGKMTKGIHRISFPAGDLASGIYFMEFHSQGYSKIKKFIINKL